MRNLNFKKGDLIRLKKIGIKQIVIFSIPFLGQKVKPKSTRFLFPKNKTAIYLGKNKDEIIVYINEKIYFIYYGWWRHLTKL